MGCPYIQIDAPDFGQLIDPAQQTVWAAAGVPFERVMTEGAEMLNEVASVPGVTFGLHICKGNYDSHWISAGGVRIDRLSPVSAPEELRPDPARVRERALRIIRAAQGAARRQGHRPRPGLIEVRRARIARSPDRADRAGAPVLSPRPARALDPVRVRVRRSRERDQRGRRGEEAPADRGGRRSRVGLTRREPARVVSWARWRSERRAPGEDRGRLTLTTGRRPAQTDIRRRRRRPCQGAHARHARPDTVKQDRVECQALQVLRVPMGLGQPPMDRRGQNGLFVARPLAPAPLLAACAHG